MEGLNHFLNGVGTLSVTDMRRAANMGCEVAMSVCKPISGTRSPYGYGASALSTGAEAEKYAAMAKAFAAITDGKV